MQRTHINRYPRPAHCFYVDATAGNNANSGAADKPIQTIAAVNALALKSGDRVLFKSGETWTNTRFTIPGSGIAGRPILFGKYGAGANPIINHNSGWNIDITSRQWVVMDSINVTSASSNGYNILDADHIYIRNADISGMGADCSGIDINASANNGKTHHVMISGCTLHDFNGFGITGAAYPIYSCQYLDLNVHDIGNDTSPQHHGLYINNQDNLLVDRCVINNSYCMGIKTIALSNSIIRNTKITNSGLSTSTGKHIGLNTGCTDIRIENCLLAFCISDAGGIASDANNITNITIINNTIVENYLGIVLPTGATGWVIKNNIIYQDAAYLSSVNRTALSVVTAADIPNNIFDNNNWFFRNGGGVNNPIKVAGTTESFATWQARASAPDANGISANPVFVTDFTDLHIQTTSPCKAAGDVAAAPIADLDSVVRGAAVDCGCYEFV